ncbi:MFS transporter [Xenorhabdus ishibashii]|uniref:Multidrug resistance protein 1 n=1 Tax=Xenorhabdus ishibashii TaxID=1034471 RepID=A0A2D0KGI8_9GAMM|nr:MFS transporter [Xenorhabdus ishibashii]PHM62559.1 multidrug resistance protein 1 [Xenorhabdus ishibashii]
MFDTIATIRGLNAKLRTLFFATLSFRMGTMGFPFFAAYLIQEKSLNAIQAGVLVGVFGAGALLCDLIIGYFIKKFGSSKIIVFSLLFTSIILFFIPFLDSYHAIILFSFLWGISYESFTPAAYSETVSNSDYSTRKIAFSCNRLAINIGMAIGPFVGGFIFSISPIFVFLVNSVFALFSLIFYLFSINMKSVLNREFDGDNENNGVKKECEIMEDKKYHYPRLAFILSSVLPVHIAYALPPTFLSAYIINYTSLPSYFVGIIFFVNAFLVILFELPINKKMNDINSRISLILGLLLAAGGFVLMVASHSIIFLIIATALWSLGEMIIFPAITHYISGISSSENVDRNLGFYSAGVNIGVMITPSIAFYMMENKIISPWLFIGMFLLFISAFLTLIKKNKILWKDNA